MPGDQEIINRWSGSAPYWDKHRETIRLMFAPVTDALAEEARIGRGNSVLDIATGQGEPALTLASLVGPQGRIVGVDPIPEMVAASRQEATRLELQNAQFEVSFADHLPFPDDTFDAVVSRFGVMLFPSPLDAVREMLRVLKPGQKLVLAVWHFAERNPFHSSLSHVVDRYIKSPPPKPDAPDAFRLAAPGRLRKILNEAGVAATTERLLQFTIDLPMSAEDYWALRLDISAKFRERISQLPQERMLALKREALEAVREYSTEQGIRFPAEALIVSGTKGRSL